jgi:SNF2 family DNA or RNA helicase
MARLVNLCPICSKPLELIREELIANTVFQAFKCGHSFAKQQLEEADASKLDFTSIDGSGHSARKYQEEGVKFILDSNFQCVLADQMRLGKTPQALLALKNSDKYPCLILVRAANLYQWAREIRKWNSSKVDYLWIIEGTKAWIPDMFQVYLMSMDTFSRRGTCKSCSHQYHEDSCKKCEKEGLSCRFCVPAGDAMSDQLLKFGFKLCIVDEAHSFKNTDSNRSQALVAFLKSIERETITHTVNFNCPMCRHQWEETVELNISTQEEVKNVTKRTNCPECYAQISVSAAAHIKIDRKCGIVMLTGTAIKNRAEEYFVPLNLVAPEHFPSLAYFRRRWLETNSKGQYTKINKYRLDDFKKLIKPLVLRREKEDIYTELPKLNRLHTVISITDERLKKAYNKVLDTLEEKNPSGRYDYFSSIGELQKLREIAGLAKVGFVTNYAESFIEDSERSKLAIGYHHYSVRDSLRLNLKDFGICKLDGQDSPSQKDYIAHKYFEKAPEQILLLGETACKEGIELVYIDYILQTERQWNPADESQFEYRFYNPDLDFLKSRGLENKVTTIEYIMADKTIDRFFHEMNIEKAENFNSTCANNWIEDDQASFQQLVERTLGSRL